MTSSQAGGCPSGSSAYVAEYVHKVGGDRKTEGPFCINDNAFSNRNTLGAALRKAGVLMSGARVVSFRIVGGENIAVFPSAPGLTTYWHSIVLKPSGTLGGVRETGRIVADFNTLEDLVAHAARDLGATHAIIAGPETKIFFPRGGTHSYEEARVWRKGGYWHAEGPGARTGVSRLPAGAKPIGGARRAAEPRRRVSESSPGAAGAAYADDQINGAYFLDWARDQLIESNRNPEGMLPLETKEHAVRIARNMLQQLEWDTKRELNESKEFFEGFTARLADRAVIGWLADELLSMNAEIVGAAVAERPRGTVRAGANSAPIDVLRALQPGDFVTVESPDLRKPRKLTVTGLSQYGNTYAVSVNSGMVRPGHRSGGSIYAHGNDPDVYYQATLQQQTIRVSRLTRTAAALAERTSKGVHDYAAVDTRDRVIAGPFKQYSDAKDAAGAGGHVKYVPGKRALNERLARRFRVGSRVVMALDALENYGQRWQGIVFKVTHVATSHSEHPGFDPGGASALYDLEIDLTKEPFGNSLYDWELEPAPAGMKPRRRRTR